MADEIAVADSGASAASTEAAVPAATPTETAPVQEAQPEQPQFDASLFDSLETEALPQDDQQVNQYLSISPYIQDEQTLQNAIQRQGQVEAVLQGQAPAGALFEPMREQNPQQWAKLMEGVVQYAEQITGMKFMDPAQAGGQQMTPEQQRIAQLESREQERQQAQQAQETAARQQQVLKQIQDAIPSLTKGRFINGEDPAWVMAKLAQKLPGKGDLIASQLARGDTALLEKTIKQINNETIEKFKARGQRWAKQRMALNGAVPKTPGTKGTPDLKLPSEKIDTKNPNWYGEVATRIWNQK